MTESSYTKDGLKYEALLKELYENYDSVELPPEYAYFVNENLMQLLIRLSRYKFVTRQLRPKDKVLEIGCGSGLGSIFLSQFCHSVYGLDVKEREIRDAKRISKRNNLSFIQKDFFEYSSEDKFDVIVMMDVIEHMDESTGRKMLQKATKHLNPHGILFIGTPSIYSFEYQSAFSKAGHVKLYDQMELIKIVEEYYGRAIAFSMNDETIHTGFAKLAWYYFILAFLPKTNK